MLPLKVARFLRLYKVKSICGEIKFHFPFIFKPNHPNSLSTWFESFRNDHCTRYMRWPFFSFSHDSSTYRQIFVCSSRDGTRCLETRRTLFRGKVQSPANLNWCRGRGRGKGTASENSTRLSPFDLIGGFETNGGGRLRRLKWRFGHGRGLRSWNLVNGPCETIDPSSRDSRLFFSISLVKYTGIYSKVS